MGKRVGIAKFEKVSFKQFKEDYKKLSKKYHTENIYTDDELRIIYDNIKLPTRATSGSAGYDFKSPFKFDIFPKTSMVIPTGIRCNIDSDWVLMLFPRSGLGFKHRFQLCNTVGVIDSDYYNSNNEGHIMVKIIYEGFEFISEYESGYSFYKPVSINDGQGIVQGVFIRYGITEDDDVNTIRDGGFGSTDK